MLISPTNKCPSSLPSSLSPRFERPILFFSHPFPSSVPRPQGDQGTTQGTLRHTSTLSTIIYLPLLEKSTLFPALYLYLSPPVLASRLRNVLYENSRCHKHTRSTYIDMSIMVMAGETKDEAITAAAVCPKATFAMRWCGWVNS